MANRAATLVVFLAFAAAASTPTAAAAAAAEQQADSWKDEKYILPILRAGPNNQLRHLRFMLALAKQLNRTLILPGITKHYTDRGSRYRLPKVKTSSTTGTAAAAAAAAGGATAAGTAGVAAAGLSSKARSSLELPQEAKHCFREEMPYQIEFSEILDRQYVEEFARVTTADEMRQRGWDSVIDAFVYANDTYKLDRLIPYVHMTATAAKAQLYHDLVVTTTHPHVLRCNQSAIKALRDKVDKWRVVMMMFLVVGNAEVVSLPGEGLQEPQGSNTCWHDLFKANRRLKGNAWLHGVAQQYIHEHVGLEPFLAMHVRPQADGCWKHWMNRNFDPAALSRKGVCWAGHDQLHRVVGPKARAAMIKHKLTKLVVLTHPNLQPVINEMLEKVNLTATYIVPSRVASIARCQDTSSTFLMLVEMQVAVQSAVFLGTASSSITETVLYERLANGNAANEYLDRPFLKAPPSPPPHSPSPPPLPPPPPAAA